jgi:hypothetical protein
MTNHVSTVAAAALFAISVAPFANVASAMPAGDPIVSENAAPAYVETVQWRGRGSRGEGFGAGFLGGAIVGGMLASPYYYGPGPYYSYPGPYYVEPSYVGAAPGDEVAYCIQRFRSYDQRSGTYLGNDGYRHPCP